MKTLFAFLLLLNFAYAEDAQSEQQPTELKKIVRSCDLYAGEKVARISVTFQPDGFGDYTPENFALIASANKFSNPLSDSTRIEAQSGGVKVSEMANEDINLDIDFEQNQLVYNRADGEIDQFILGNCNKGLNAYFGHGASDDPDLDPYNQVQDTQATLDDSDPQIGQTADEVIAQEFSDED
jgi:hypothetical protein